MGCISFLVLFLGLFSVCNAASPNYCVTGVTDACSAYIPNAGSYSWFNITGIGLVQANVSATFNYINSLPLCQNCRQNMLRLFCATNYPLCGTFQYGGFNFQVPQIPCQDSCQSAVNTCIPSDLPMQYTNISTQFINQYLGAFAASFGINSANLGCSAFNLMFSLNGYNFSSQQVGCNEISSQMVTTNDVCVCQTPTLNFCNGYVTYPVFSFLAQPNIVSEIESIVNQTVQPLLSLDMFTCPNCSTGIRQSACIFGFPPCNSTDPVIPVCQSTCEESLGPCGLSSVTNAGCAFFPTDNCATLDIPTLGACQYCVPISSFPSGGNPCASIVDYPILNVSLASLGISITNLYNFLDLALQSMTPTCAACDAAVQKELCALMFVPCTTQLVDNLVLTLLTTQTGSLFSVAPRPCQNQCIEVLDNVCQVGGGSNSFVSCTGVYPAGSVNIPLYSTSNCGLIPTLGTNYLSCAPTTQTTPTPSPSNNDARRLLSASFFTLFLLLLYATF